MPDDVTVEEEQTTEAAAEEATVDAEAAPVAGSLVMRQPYHRRLWGSGLPQSPVSCPIFMSGRAGGRHRDDPVENRRDRVKRVFWMRPAW